MKKIVFLFGIASFQFLQAQCSLTVNVNVTNASCYGACNGSATASAIGGAAPYTYTWVPSGGAIPVVNGLCAGNYTVTVNDANGCAGVSTVTVMQPAPIMVNPAANPMSVCPGQTTTLTVTSSGGAGGYTYTWSPGGNTSSTWTVTPASTIVTTVTAADANGCTKTAGLTVQVYAQPSLSFSLTPTGTPQVWDIVANYSGGTPSYTYLWTWGDGTSDNTAFPTHNYAAAGMYNICGKVTDANGCSDQVCQNDSVYRGSSASSVITINVINGATAIDYVPPACFQVFPVPAVNFFTVKHEGAYELSLVDLTGKLILKRNTIGNTIVQVEDIESGIYLLQIKDTSGQMSRKTVIVQRQ